MGTGSSHRPHGSAVAIQLEHTQEGADNENKMEILSRETNGSAKSGRSSALSLERSIPANGTAHKAATNGVNGARPSTKQRARTRVRGNRIPFPDEYPKPLPPTNKRNDICFQQVMQEIDEYVFDAPEELLVGSYPNLVKYLVNDGKWGDVGKARAIYRWITTIDVYALLDKEPPTDTPLEYFQRMRKGAGNHAHLFAGLCKFADLKCVIVNGINKSAAYDVGEKINRRKMAAQWNAVHLNGSWRFVDVFWASTCIVGRKTGKWTLLEYDGRTVDRKISRDDGREEHRSNDFFFLTEPEQLIYTHFPNDCQWQLLKNPLTFQDFEEAAYVREMFFVLNMELTEKSHHKCVVHSDSGEVHIEVGLPKQSEHYTFKYTVYLEEEPGEVRSFNDDVQLENFVLYQQSETFLRYTTRFPTAGTFKVDIYGNDESQNHTLDLLTSYIIRCSKPFANCQPLPDTPAIGWGVGKKAHALGIHAKSHEDGVIESTDGTFEIRLKLEKEINLNQIILHNTINSDDLQQHAVTRIENGEAIINVRLPAGNSEYALKLYGNEAENPGEMENICNYLLRSMAHPPQPSYPKLASSVLGEKPLIDKFGVTPLTHPSGLIETTDGKVTVQFAKEKGVELSCELTNNDLFEESLKKCVHVEQDDDTARFTLDLEEVGEYGLNIYGKQSDDKRQIFNLYNYLIQRNYDENSERRVLKPLRPPVGLKADVDDTNNVNKKAEENYTIVTSERKHKLRVPATSKKTLGELRRVNAVGRHMKGAVKIKRDLDEDVITLDIPDDGEYVLNLFEKRGRNCMATTKSYNVVKDSSRVIKDNDSLDGVSSDAESLDSCSSELRHIGEEPDPPNPGPKRDEDDLSDYTYNGDDQDSDQEFSDTDQEEPNILVISGASGEYVDEFDEDGDDFEDSEAEGDDFYDGDTGGELITDVISVGEQHEDDELDDEDGRGSKEDHRRGPLITAFGLLEGEDRAAGEKNLSDDFNPGDDDVDCDDEDGRGSKGDHRRGPLKTAFGLLDGEETAYGEQNPNEDFNLGNDDVNCDDDNDRSDRNSEREGLVMDDLVGGQPIFDDHNDEANGHDGSKAMETDDETAQTMYDDVFSRCDEEDAQLSEEQRNNTCNSQLQSPLADVGGELLSPEEGRGGEGDVQSAGWCGGDAENDNRRSRVGDDLLSLDDGSDGEDRRSIGWCGDVEDDENRSAMAGFIVEDIGEELHAIAEEAEGESRPSSKHPHLKADGTASESTEVDSDKDTESPVVEKTEEELEAERKAEEERIAREAETNKAKQQKRLTERLTEALKVRGDVDRLSRAISKFVSAGIENDALLAEGRRLLELWTLILNLDTGIRTRNSKLIDSAIKKANFHDDNELRNYVAVGHRVMEQIRKIERLRHSILKLNQKTIAEIRAYSRPPAAVEQVMVASFLLLGEEEYELKDWKWIQSLMGRTGYDSVKKRVATLNIDDVPIEVALRAQQLYEGFTLNDVRDVSAGAAAFYKWTTGMIEASINNFKNLGGDLLSVRPRSCRRPGTRGRPFTMAGSRPGTQGGRRPRTQSRPLTQGDIPRPETPAQPERQLSQDLPPKVKVSQW